VADDEPELPMADALLAQFQQRQIFVECDVIDDRILSDSWLATSVRTLTEDSSDQQVSLNSLVIFIFDLYASLRQLRLM